MRGARAVLLLAVPLLVVPLLAVPLLAAPAASADPSGTTPTGPGATQADPDAANLVAAEDRRLTQVRTVTSLARWQGKKYESPFRMSSSTGYTLVLTARSAPYTVQDLVRLEPQTLGKLSDGSYLLSEHVVVAPGATLRLSGAGGLTLRLLSNSRGFVSLVSTGGRLELAGAAGAPVRITSWDLDRGALDTDPSDGRAYVRASGGQFEASHAELDALGFWSGRTGGLALTGTDRPNTGAITPAGTLPEGSTPSVLEGVQTAPAGPLPPGAVTAPGFDVPSFDYVSSNISSTTIDGNAFGLFVSGANGLQVSDTVVRHSLISGVVLHRFVSNGVVSRTTSEDNAGDGFSLDRATTGISLTRVTSTRNAGNGVTLSGRPLADGPSPTGATTTQFGGNSVANSVVQGNARYGIQVLGGSNVGVQNNQVRGGDMGIVVTGPADHVSVTGNHVSGSGRHGVSLTGGVTDASVTGNVVDGSRTGIYLRDAAADVEGNTVQHAQLHGVSAVGAVKGTTIGYNVLTGTGPSALDKARAGDGLALRPNQTGGWDDTSPWYDWFKKLLHPMNLLWAVIAVLTALSAMRSRRRSSQVQHPYAHQMAHHGVLALPRQSDVIDLDAGERVAGGSR